MNLVYAATLDHLDSVLVLVDLEEGGLVALVPEREVLVWVLVVLELRVVVAGLEH